MGDAASAAIDRDVEMRFGTFTITVRRFRTVGLVFAGLIALGSAYTFTVAQTRSTQESSSEDISPLAKGSHLFTWRKGEQRREEVTAAASTTRPETATPAATASAQTPDVELPVKTLLGRKQIRQHPKPRMSRPVVEQPHVKAPVAKSIPAIPPAASVRSELVARSVPGDQSVHSVQPKYEYATFDDLKQQKPKSQTPPPLAIPQRPRLPKDATSVSFNSFIEMEIEDEVPAQRQAPVVEVDPDFMAFANGKLPAYQPKTKTIEPKLEAALDQATLLVAESHVSEPSSPVTQALPTESNAVPTFNVSMTNEVAEGNSAPISESNLQPARQMKPTGVGENPFADFRFEGMDEPESKADAKAELPETQPTLNVAPEPTLPKLKTTELVLPEESMAAQPLITSPLPTVDASSATLPDLNSLQTGLPPLEVIETETPVTLEANGPTLNFALEAATHVEHKLRGSDGESVAVADSETSKQTNTLQITPRTVFGTQTSDAAIADSRASGIVITSMLADVESRTARTTAVGDGRLPVISHGLSGFDHAGAPEPTPTQGRNGIAVNPASHRTKMTDINSNEPESATAGNGDHSETSNRTFQPAPSSNRPLSLSGSFSNAKFQRRIMRVGQEDLEAATPISETVTVEKPTGKRPVLRFDGAENPGIQTEGPQLPAEATSFLPPDLYAPPERMSDEDVGFPVLLAENSSVQSSAQGSKSRGASAADSQLLPRVAENFDGEEPGHVHVAGENALNISPSIIIGLVIGLVALLLLYHRR